MQIIIFILLAQSLFVYSPCDVNTKKLVFLCFKTKDEVTTARRPIEQFVFKSKLLRMPEVVTGGTKGFTEIFAHLQSRMLPNKRSQFRQQLFKSVLWKVGKVFINTSHS